MPNEYDTSHSSVAFRMPKTVRRLIRIAAGLDDQRIPAWCIATLERAALERIAAETKQEDAKEPT